MGGLSDVIQSDILPIVSKAAPLLGSVLGSPLAGVAISLIAQAFGVNPRDISAVSQALTSPDAAEKLKALEYSHIETLEQIAASGFASEVDDRKNARLRQMTLKDHVPTIMAIGFLINYAAIQFYVVTHNNPINDIISARFQDVLLLIVSYYFGSSYKINKES